MSSSPASKHLVGEIDGVSVLMPARNASKTIAEAARSVLSQREVSELIVVNDGSKDSTRQSILSLGDPRIILIGTNGVGIPKALNIAIERSSARYIARCDADDRFTPKRLEAQFSFLKNNDAFCAISGGFTSIDVRGNPVVSLASDGDSREVTDDLKNGRPITHLGTFLMRADAVRRLGGFRTWFATAEDADFMFRLAGIGKIWHDPHPCYEYRLHNASTVHTQPSVQRLFFEQAAIDFAQERLAGESDSLDRGVPPPVPSGEAESQNPAEAQIAGHLEGAAWAAFHKGNRSDAFKLILRSISVRRRRVSGWKSLMLMLFSRRG